MAIWKLQLHTVYMMSLKSIYYNTEKKKDIL